ncbi:AAA family ATPase [Actinomycetes bacterium KLBMP 9797]
MTIPVLWLCGPPGVGKTTVAWELFGQLTAAGVRTGYVDIDQLGICYLPPSAGDEYPEPAADPGRHRLKTRNLGAVVRNFHAAGARCVIVSGVVDATHGVHIDQLTGAALTVCRLRADRDELRRRLIGRRRQWDPIDAGLAEADLLDRTGFADLVVDTTGRSVADVVRVLRAQTVLIGDPSPRPDAGQPVRVPVEILWLCGVTGVGKSTVGWQVWDGIRRDGTPAGFVDLDQIGYLRPADSPSPADSPGPAGTPGPVDHDVRARNLAAIWETYHANGAQRLVVVGPLDRAEDVRPYRDALPAAALTVCRLHAGSDELTRRILSRGQGGGPDVPGDWLRGRPEAFLRDVAAAAASSADALDRAAVGDLRLDTDGRSADDAARAVRTMIKASL